MTPLDNTGRILTKRIHAKDGTTLMIYYPAFHAHEMRNLVQFIRIKGKQPSMALIARRSMALYVERMKLARDSHPDLFEREVRALADMVTHRPQPALKSKKRPSGAPQ
jgi:hypothetical protein